MLYILTNSISPALSYPRKTQGVVKRLRLAANMGALDELNTGETMGIVNDHNFLSLLALSTPRYGKDSVIN